MVAILPGNIKVDGAFSSSAIQIPDHFSITAKIQVNACDVVGIWIPTQELNDVPPMHMKCEVVANSDSVWSSFETLPQNLPNLTRASARSARVNQLAQCVN